jgi:transcription elongation GreA/GreB family factor
MESLNLPFKQKVLTECIKLQREVVSSAKSAVLDAQDSAVNYDGGSEDNLMESYREEMQNKRDMFAKQLDLALDDQNLLNQIQPDKLMDTVSFGSIVYTDQQKLFVSISLGTIKVDGESLFAISPSAPLYKAMTGKKVGESFTFRDKQIKVLDVV